jgi:DNA-binding MarR family transcriptional regulator
MVDPVAEVEVAMVAIRRRQARRLFARAAEVQDDSGQQVIDAIEAAGDEPIGVNGVAEALGVDQPRASKLVAAAVSAGLIRREADQLDGRRTNLALTDAGRERLETVHTFRRRRFAAAMDDWPEADRAAFATLLTRFVAGLGQQ